LATLPFPFNPHGNNMEDMLWTPFYYTLIL
jgi:hypothetical protein